MRVEGIVNGRSAVVYLNAGLFAYLPEGSLIKSLKLGIIGVKTEKGEIFILDWRPITAFTIISQILPYDEFYD